VDALTILRGRLDHERPTALPVTFGFARLGLHALRLDLADVGPTGAGVSSDPDDDRRGPAAGG
jgi:hypothetical protein